METGEESLPLEEGTAGTGSGVETHHLSGPVGPVNGSSRLPGLGHQFPEIIRKCIGITHIFHILTLGSVTGWNFPQVSFSPAA